MRNNKNEFTYVYHSSSLTKIVIALNFNPLTNTKNDIILDSQSQNFQIATILYNIFSYVNMKYAFVQINNENIIISTPGPPGTRVVKAYYMN